jgi:hypothetical protein
MAAVPRFDGSMFDGTFNVDDREVAVRLNLSILASPSVEGRGSDQQGARREDSGPPDRTSSRVRGFVRWPNAAAAAFAVQGLTRAERLWPRSASLNHRSRAWSGQTCFSTSSISATFHSRSWAVVETGLESGLARVSRMRKKAARSSGPWKIRNFDSCPRSLLKPSVRKIPKILWSGRFSWAEQRTRSPCTLGAKGDQQSPDAAARGMRKNASKGCRKFGINGLVNRPTPLLQIACG